LTTRILTTEIQHRTRLREEPGVSFDPASACVPVTNMPRRSRNSHARDIAMLQGTAILGNIATFRTLTFWNFA